jgi:hypothetical protein
MRAADVLPVRHSEAVEGLQLGVVAPQRFPRPSVAFRRRTMVGGANEGALPFILLFTAAKSFGKPPVFGRPDRSLQEVD